MFFRLSIRPADPVQAAAARAAKAAKYLRRKFGINHENDIPRIAVIQGTGWYGVLQKYFQKVGMNSILLESIPGMKGLRKPIAGHGYDRWIHYGILPGYRIPILICSRIHLHESPVADFQHQLRLRLFFEMLKEFGIKTIVATSFVGSLDDSLLKVDDLLIVTNFLNTHNLSLPLWSEFCVADDAIDPAQVQKTMQLASFYQKKVHSGASVTIAGPQIESPLDKKTFRSTGGLSIGMSAGVEGMFCSLFNMKILPIGWVGNDSEEKHKHESFTVRAEKFFEQRERFLHQVIQII